MKVVLVVDLEETYLTDDDFMGMIFPEYWEVTRKEMRDKFEQIVLDISQLKEEGWKVHFTGKELPYPSLRPLVDDYLPYWEHNQSAIASFYSPDTEVMVVGIFYERCVHAVNQLVSHSYKNKSLCVSHEMIGDSEDYFLDFTPDFEMVER